MSDEKKVPKLRFINFNDEWETTKIGNLFTFFKTNSFSRDKLNNKEGKVQNIHYGDIYTKFHTILDYEYERVKIPYINSDVDISKINKDSYCKNGDLIIADASHNYEDIGKTIELLNIGKNDRLVAGLHTILARNSSNLLVDGFKGYLFLSENVKLNIKIIANGSVVLGISKTDLSTVPLNFPSKEEQIKIAHFLHLIDIKIESQKNEIKLMEDYKKGLLQQMFI